MILNLYSLCGETGDAQKLFDSMPQRDVITWNTMISQLVKRGDIEGAHKYFLKMPERSVRSWTVMISGFVQYKKPEEAIRLFREMEEEAEIKPNEVTTVAVLGACADLGALDLGRQIHKNSDLSGFRKNIHISNTLIEMYVKCGYLDGALKVFKNMEERTVVSYSAMISGFALHGKAEEALRLFNRMIRSGMKPNKVTFVGVLHACSHMGLVTEGRELFARMIGDYGIAPEIEHYGCMVDLYSRAGHLQEAHEFITNMPTKANGIIWGTLLGGCRVHKNIKLAEEAIRHLSYLDPQNDGYYILMSNIYADSHRWEEAAIVRKSMKYHGVRKTPGWSLITVNGETHKFLAGDESHVQCEDIRQRWDILLGEMKLMGYVPNTSVVLLDMEESEKVKTLYSHSEKLALVFGLINTKPGKTIRIMKNLRVCEDCHAAFKILSGVVKREIVVRDRNRFHSFKDGSCSCKDYW